MVTRELRLRMSPFIEPVRAHTSVSLLRGLIVVAAFYGTIPQMAAGLSSPYILWTALTDPCEQPLPTDATAPH